MRPHIAVAVVLVSIGAAAAQDVPPRFDVIYNPDLYKQDTPQETLNAVLGAIARDRYDYVIAHLLDPAFVEARLGTNRAYFERVAAEQIASTGGGAGLKGADLELRIRDVATRLAFKDLGRRIREKLGDEPDNLKDMKRFARDGQFQVAGEAATASLKDVKDRAIYFKKANDRWFLENRKEDTAPPAKE
jgi:hypothetical protein